MATVVKADTAAPPMRPLVTRRASKIEMLTGESQENIEKFQMMQKAYKKLGIFDNNATPQSIESRRSSLTSLESSNDNNNNENKDENPKSPLLRKLGVNQQQLDEHLAQNQPRRSSLPSIHEAGLINNNNNDDDDSMAPIASTSPSSLTSSSLSPSNFRPILSSRRASKIELLTGESEEIIAKTNMMQKAYNKLGIYDEKTKHQTVQAVLAKENNNANSPSNSNIAASSAIETNSPPSSPSLITSQLSPAPSTIINNANNKNNNNNNNDSNNPNLQRRPSRVESFFDKFSMKLGVSAN